MATKWWGPRRSSFRTISSLLLVAPALLVLVPVVHSPPVLEEVIAMGIGFGTLYVLDLGVYLRIRHAMRSVWRSERRPLPLDLQRARRAIAKALAERGRAFRQRSPSDRSGGVTFDLGGGLNITLLEHDRGCLAHVGPACHRTRGDVEGLKRLVDATVPRARA